MPLDRSIGNYFDSSGSFIRRVARWSGPTNYVTGGETVDASTFGMGKIVSIFFSPAPNASGAAVAWPAYNFTTGKVTWYTAGAGGVAEIAGGTNLGTYVGSVEVIGS